jgi:N-acetylglucosaminyl-diphospho-decaprenol L-rhamnosyltransferase
LFPPRPDPSSHARGQLTTASSGGRPRELPAATIVICTWGFRDLLLRCLASLEASIPPAWGIIVVVNADVDGTVEAISASFPRVRLVANRRNRGVGPARNQGLAMASSEVVILLDADTETPRGALEGLAATLMSEPNIGVVGPRLVSSSGDLQHTARNFPTVLTKIRRRAPTALRRALPSDDLADSELPREVGYVIGACQAIRSTALQEVGLLDEAIFYGPEDVDLCLRMWKGGWRVVWDPTVTIMHHEQRRTRRKLLSALTVRHGAGLARYFVKHRYLFRAPRFGQGPAAGVGDR